MRHLPVIGEFRKPCGLREHNGVNLSPFREGSNSTVCRSNNGSFTNLICPKPYVFYFTTAVKTPDFSGEAWLKCKFNKGLDFPNLPYLIDDGFMITQSNAILEYVADKNGMLPNSAKERAVLHMLQGELTDFRANLRLLIFNPDFKNLKEGYLDGLPVKLQAWSDYLGDKLWLTGEMINYPDFKLYDLLDSLRALESNCLDKFANLKNYMNRFEALEPIKQFQNSDAYMARPFFGPKASWQHGNA